MAGPTAIMAAPCISTAWRRGIFVSKNNYHHLFIRKGTHTFYTLKVQQNTVTRIRKVADLKKSVHRTALLLWQLNYYENSGVMRNQLHHMAEHSNSYLLCG